MTSYNLWTSDKPTIEGYFWIKKPDGLMVIVEIKKGKTGLLIQELTIKPGYNSQFTRLQEFNDTDCLWSDKIKTPDELAIEMEDRDMDARGDALDRGL